jgi:hypothetical protein
MALSTFTRVVLCKPTSGLTLQKSANVKQLDFRGITDCEVAHKMLHYAFSHCNILNIILTQVCIIH